MKLQQLKYFNELCRVKSFSKVASKFKVTQPTVSYAIKGLEDTLGVQLILRNQSHTDVSLTKEGELFRKYSLNALQQLGKGITAVKNAHDGRIKIGITAALSRFFDLTKHISSLEEIFETEIGLLEDGSKEITQKILSNKLDIALFGTSKEVFSDQLDLKKIATFPFKLAVSKKHPLAKESRVHLAQVEDEKFILFNEHFIHHEIFWRFMNSYRIIPNILAEVSDIQGFESFIQQKNTIGILVDFLKLDHIHLIELDEPEPVQFYLYLAKQKDGKITDEAFNETEFYIKNQIHALKN
ncbi:LysR family transcriptional regulator [uncultured Granulicatella sp.]|uniref:LysR family transcriptional regulator n=1 Tax=uncultured Granulicatella sp. TaxID=316089 RepID=UPI0028D51E52|nr:LysR family transcriptional regulator [uncultured Granulicatella sp.]